MVERTEVDGRSVSFRPLTPPKYAEYLRAKIPQSKLLILEGAGHTFPMERAPEVAKAIRAFLSSL